MYEIAFTYVIGSPRPTIWIPGRFEEKGDASMVASCLIPPAGYTVNVLTKLGDVWYVVA
jgi:hypothetical protein